MKKNLLSISLLTMMVVLLNSTLIFAQPGGPGGFAPVITEIMYNPPETGNDTLEFIEILNPSLSTSIPMEGFYFSSGVEYTFPPGFVLGAGEYVIISGDSVIFEDWYNVSAFEWTGGTALSNSGEGLTLRAPNGTVADTVFFDDTNAWPSGADAGGYSLVLCDPSSDNNLPENWTISENNTGLVVNSLSIFADPAAASTCTPTGIADNERNTTLVFPNPTEGAFFMKFAAIEKSGTLRIHNSLGQLVYTQVLSVGTTSVSINTQLVSGFYMLSLDNGASIEHHNLTVK